MTADRIAWGFESDPIREQIRIRTARAGDAPIRLHDFERRVLASSPPYNETASDVLRALDDLATCRPEGFAGPGRIPITVIWEYLARKGYDSAATEILTRAILDADRVYLEQREKMLAQKAGKP
jgi:hypothetical protein